MNTWLKFIQQGRITSHSNYLNTLSRGIMYLLSNYILLEMRDLNDYKNKKTRQFNHVDST